MKDWDLGGELPEIATPFITHKLKPGFERDVQAHEAMVDYILSQCPNLQSLVDADPLYSFSLKSSSKLMPFLTQSLKKLFIPTDTVFELPPSALSVETVIWILVFCRSLEQVVLGVFIGAKGERYLAEYTSTFKGLSNVKQAAFSFYFDWNNPKANLRWKCGSRRSDTVFNFLQVTSSRLESAELSVNARMDSNQLESDSNKEVCVDAISGLGNSFSSLKHLRLIGLFPDFEKKKLTDFTVFSSLKYLSVEGVILQVLAVLPSRLPPNLEVLHCPFHAYQGSGDTSDGFEEDEYLSHIIERPIPKLKQVVVPGTPISIFGELPISKQQISIWKGYRKQFSETSIFKSGKVKLKELMPGETSE